MEYHKATICVNGHVVSSTEKNHNIYCDECGSETITQCPVCSADIRGCIKPYGYNLVYTYTPPKSCYKCGNPFPWTIKKNKFSYKARKMMSNFFKQSTKAIPFLKPIFEFLCDLLKKFTI